MSGIKNTCRVFYPEYLDLTPFTTSGELSTLPSAPISTPSPRSTPSRSSSIPTVSRPASLPIIPILYRLAAVVCHYGTHSFGHYVAYRRKPKPPSDKNRFDPPPLKCAQHCTCEKCKGGNAQAQLDEDTHDSRWLRISDETVDEVGIERVLAENSGVYMLYYERVVMPQQLISSSLSSADGWNSSDGSLSHTWLSRNTPHSSEETITPANSVLHGKKELSPPPSTPEKSTPFEARIIHRVHAGRSKSLSGRSTPLSDVSPSPSKIFTNGDACNPPLPPEVKKIPNGDIPNDDSHSTSVDLEKPSSDVSSADSQPQLQFRHSTRTFLNGTGLQRTTGLRA